MLPNYENGSTGGTPNEPLTHFFNDGGRSPLYRTINGFLDKCITLSELYRQDLGASADDKGKFVNNAVSFALDHLESYGLKQDVTELIRALYHDSPAGERFVLDPIRQGTLMLDAEGEIVTLFGSRTVNNGKELTLESFRDGIVLSGPHKGEKFTSSTRDIPEPGLPIYTAVQEDPVRLVHDLIQSRGGIQEFRGNREIHHVMNQTVQRICSEMHITEDEEISRVSSGLNTIVELLATLNRSDGFLGNLHINGTYPSYATRPDNIDGPIELGDITADNLYAVFAASLDSNFHDYSVSTRGDVARRLIFKTVELELAIPLQSSDTYELSTHRVHVRSTNISSRSQLSFEDDSKVYSFVSKEGKVMQLGYIPYVVAALGAS